jgi:hypothetical protein
MVYQDLALAGNLNIAENIYLGREPKRTILGGALKLSDHKSGLRMAQEHLDKLKIHVKSVAQKVEKLSGGQRHVVDRHVPGDSDGGNRSVGRIGSGARDDDAGGGECKRRALARRAGAVAADGHAGGICERARHHQIADAASIHHDLGHVVHGVWRSQPYFGWRIYAIGGNPNLKAVFASNDNMGLGAIEALKSDDMLDRVFVVGFDANPDAAESVLAGEMSASLIRLSIPAPCWSMLRTRPTSNKSVRIV